MKTFLGTLFLFLLIFTNCYADKKFDKDLKKVSKLNGFVDSKGAIYSIEQISNKYISFAKKISIKPLKVVNIKDLKEFLKQNNLIENKLIKYKSLIKHFIHNKILK